MNKFRVNLYDILLCLSNAQDLVSPILSNHQQQVAYLSFRLAERVGLTRNEQKNIFLAGLVHDIGALSLDERLEIIEKEAENIHAHSIRGAMLLEEFHPLRNVAQIIKYHHIPWNHGDGQYYLGEKVPYSSHIIHLADRVCASLDMHSNILSQIPTVLSAIQAKKSSIFHPDQMDALTEISKNEFIWLDLASRHPTESMDLSAIGGGFDTLVLEMNELVDLALVMSHIIDFRSSFTARHSAGVAKIAERLAELMDFSPDECKMMLIAGYLHDLGKLAIDNKVLEKDSALNEEEFNEIRSHTYYTYHLLNAIEPLHIINMWASFHHERLDGKGYPFHIKGENMPLGSRIMAVADVFTAITEDRPYRVGMNTEKAVQVLRNMVRTNAIDTRVVDLLMENLQAISDLRKVSQEEASRQYAEFMLQTE